MTARVHNLAFALAALLLATPLFAQTAPPAERVVRMNGALPTAAGQQATIHFAIYDANEGGNLLWKETQIVAVDAAGQYTAFLGAMSADGMPLDLFAGGAPRWLAVEGPTSQVGTRTLLAAVPYAVTAANAATLAGRPATDFLLTPAARRKDAGTTAGAGVTSATDPLASTGPLTAGTIGKIGKFVTSVDLGDSVMTESGGRIGVNATSPLDVIHSRFTDAGGAITGLAVQNLSGGANAYSGMLFYDQLGNLGQFQGFNNSTHEYRINNIASGGSINFMIGGSSKFLVANSGNIGIGTTSPSYALDVQHGSSAGLRVKSTVDQLIDIDAGATSLGLLRFADNGAFRWTMGKNNTNDDFIVTEFDAGGARRLVIQDATGYIGIGTTTPGVPLDVVGSQSGIAVGTTSFFTSSSTGITNIGSNTYGTVTIRASNQILGSVFGAYSDARIKSVKGRSNAVADLQTLQGLEITDYSYVDTIERGTQAQKKLVAQQVEGVYPQAVTRTTDVVPDIYKRAPFSGGWIALATDLKVGERVRLISPNGHREVHEVLEVEAGRFRTAFSDDSNEVFVYGREVKDFRVVDYEAISMLNVSATQELARRLEQQTAETAALKQELAEMRTALTAALEAVAAVRAQQQR